jgi:hypothetical protein
MSSISMPASAGRTRRTTGKAWAFAAPLWRALDLWTLLLRSPPEGRPVFQGKAQAWRKKALVLIQIFGKDRDCQIMIFPGFAGTPAPPSRRVLCFWG